MKNFKRVSVVILAGSLLLTGCNQGGGKAGTVDMMKLMQSPELKTISQSMMTQDKSAQTELKAAYDAMQAANSAAQKAKGSSSAQAQAKAAQAKFSGMMASFQKQQQSQQAELKTDVTVAIETVAKSKGLSVVYVKQAVLYGNDEDVTKDVITQLQNAKK